jgi:hypothetical protein
MSSATKLTLLPLPLTCLRSLATLEMTAEGCTMGLRFLASLGMTEGRCAMFEIPRFARNDGGSLHYV